MATRDSRLVEMIANGWQAHQVQRQIQYVIIVINLKVLQERQHAIPV
jgi:hypothetical protein